MFNDVKYKEYLENKKYSKKHYSVKNGKLYYKDKEVVKIEDSYNLIKALHCENGHCKVVPLYCKMCLKYYGITRNIIEIYVKNCHVCRILKKINVNADVIPIVTRKPRERLLIDLINAEKYNELCQIKSEDRFRFILTVIDHYTNFTYLYAQRSKTSEETVRNIENYFRLFGKVEILQHDNGLEFKNHLMSELLNKLGIKDVFSSPYHPRTNGKVEKYNHFVKVCLKGFVYEKKENWVSYLDRVIEYINCNICRRTHCSPRSLYYNDIEQILLENKKLKLEIYSKDNNNSVIDDKNGDMDDDEDDDNSSDSDSEESEFEEYKRKKELCNEDIVFIDDPPNYNEIKNNIISSITINTKIDEYISKRIIKYNNNMVNKNDEEKKNFESGDIVIYNNDKKAANKLGIIKDENSKIYIMY